MKRRSYLATLIAATWALVCCAALGTAHAENAADWPTHPIRIVVTVPAGGPQDIQARVNAQILSQAFGVGVVVENKPGGTGVLGVNYVAHARPDGYTLLAGTIGPIVAAPALNKSLPYAPLKDLAPITIAANYPLVILVSEHSRFHTFKELVEAAKARPDTISLGLLRGSSPHFLLEKLRETTGAKFLYIPYAGGNAPVTEVMAGHIEVYLTNTPGVVSLIRDGQIRALAIEGAHRAKALPEVPTLTELGYPNVEINGGWQALLAPAGTPTAIINRLHDALVAGLQAPDIKAGIEQNGGHLVLNSPQAFGAYLQAATPAITELARRGGIEPQ
ncbi:MAG: Bug family tripartite tricarboxylate transporter substrate binding protein [Janthinobacterium lividum]